MVKITLEIEDIEKLIKIKYPECEIISGLDNKMEIVIKVKEFNQPKQIPQQIEKTPEVVVTNGSIDAEKSGLTLKNREHTIPGGAMGRIRGQMHTF